MSALATAVSCLGVAMFALGMIANKLVGVEMMAVLQISFLSLLTLD